MFYMKGQLRNCYSQPPSEAKPQETYKLQIEGEIITKDEQTRLDMVNVNVPFEVFQAYRNRVGQKIVLPVGLMVSGGTGRLQPYFPKGYTREVLTSTTSRAGAGTNASDREAGVSGGNPKGGEEGA